MNAPTLRSHRAELLRRASRHLELLRHASDSAAFYQLHRSLAGKLLDDAQAITRTLHLIGGEMP